MSRTKIEQIRQARTCYGHLAGQFGVFVTEALLAHGLLEMKNNEFELTPNGEAWFCEIGINTSIQRRQRRRFAPVCIDGTERRPHLAGALGDQLATRFFELGWVERIDGSRGIRVTDRGAEGMREKLNLVINQQNE